MKRTIILSAIAALAVADAAMAAAVATVDQKNISFSTPRLVVQKGSVVAFTNSDSTSHNILITGAGVSLDSGIQQAGVTFRAPLTKAGEYAVTCAIHPKMKMTILVE